VALLVQATGPLLLVQDLGRPGSMQVGVPPSGALDPRALAMANRLVGNPESAAGLEVLLGGTRLAAESSHRIAVTGALVGVRIGHREGSWGAAEPVPAGMTVELAAAADGLRCWVAVAGGVQVEPVLGSRSTDTLTGLGPRPLAVGDRLEIGVADSSPVVAATAVPPSRPDVWRLPMSFGPRDDRFEKASLDLLLTQEYVVSPSSNRTALRLEGGKPLTRVDHSELASEGVVTGAVQVPASGLPLVFLADHPVTGGYPVVGVIEPEALTACAQARPGDRVRFLPRRSH
jgi:biotin-dependent carboxylase-like uncharacterized protein